MSQYGNITKVELLGDGSVRVHFSTSMPSYGCVICFASREYGKTNNGVGEFAYAHNSQPNGYIDITKSQIDKYNIRYVKCYYQPNLDGDFSKPLGDIPECDLSLLYKEQEKEVEEKKERIIKENEFEEGDCKMCEFPIDGEEVAVPVLIQTRALSFGDNEPKSSYRVVLRGLFYGDSDKYSGLYVMGSLDGVTWMYLGGTERQQGNVPIRDIGTTIERYSCKFIMIVYVGTLYPQSRIDNFEITLTEKYTDKIR